MTSRQSSVSGGACTRTWNITTRRPCQQWCPGVGPISPPPWRTVPCGAGWEWEGDGGGAGGAVLISPWPSHPYDMECRRATILNVYVDQEFRRQGIARQLMRTMIDWCRNEGFAFVYLHSSKNGRPLYEGLGFEPTTEMRLKL